MFRTSSTAEQRRVSAAVDRSPLLSRISQDPPIRARVERILTRYARTLQFDAGDVVCRKGDFGNAVYFVADGTICEIVRDDGGIVSVPPPPSMISSEPKRRFRIFRKRIEEDIFVVDVNYRQSLDNMDEVLKRCKVQRIGPGSSGDDDGPSGGAGEDWPFGAVPALTRSPFPRHVFAETPAKLLAVHWRGMQDLIRLSDLAQQALTVRCRNEIIDLIRSRAFDIPVFARLPAPSLEALLDRLEFRLIHGASAGVTAVRQGEPTKHVLVVVSGFGRVRRSTGGKSRSVGFVGRGDAFGLAAIASGGAGAPSKTSLDFLGNTSLLALPADTVANECVGLLSREDVFAADPSAEEELGASTRATTLELQDRSREAQLVDFLVDNAFVRGRQAMVIDQTRCVGCDACVQACADTHRGVPRFVRSGPTAGGYAVANACMHCEEAPCLVNCPTDAIFRKHSAEVVVSEVLCIGCGTCAAACPYDNIRLVELGANAKEMERSTPLALKCDLCIEQNSGPACVRACPHDAIARVDLTDHAVVPQLAAAVNLRDLRRRTP